MALRSGQRVIVADQNHIDGVQGTLKLAGVEQRIIIAKRLVELSKILPAMVRILRADFAFDPSQRVQLSGAATRSKVGDGGHINFSLELPLLPVVCPS